MKIRTFTFARNKHTLSIPISITAISSISPLGNSHQESWGSYQSPAHHFVQKVFNGNQEWIAPLAETARKEVNNVRASDAKYSMLDDSVLFAIAASRKAVQNAGWKPKDNFGINIGSSRGATTLFEKYHQEYLQQNKTSTLSSPTTTLGNISSWVAHDLQTKGPEISHSITCSTALHALLNGVAWIKGGMADKFLVGGSEAPLTPFTLAQMKALKIYAPVTSASVSHQVEAVAQHNQTTVEPTRTAAERTRAVAERSRSYPCQALNLNKKQNSMILGEGAAVACLERGVSKNALAVIEGIGYATEILEHNVSISADAKCFQKSMKMALGDLNPAEVDVIVMHAPGTIKGDLSEKKAIQKVFGDECPTLTTNKWKVGHTFGASGMLNVELAILMLQQQEFIGVPFVEGEEIPKKIDKIMINAVGFGGNAVSVLVSKK